MRTTVELPDELMAAAKTYAAGKGLSLREFFIEAVRGKLEQKPRGRRPVPVIAGPDLPKIPRLTREQIDEAMFG